jgi:transcriptional regulator with XRE-family HTH domain
MPSGKYTKYDTVQIDGRVLAQLRSSHQPHLTQDDLATHALVSRGYISSLERGVRQVVSRAVAERLTDALGIDLNDLLLSLPEAAGEELVDRGETVDLTQLSKVLARLPRDQQQRCIDAIMTLITAGMPE